MKKSALLLLPLVLIFIVAGCTSTNETGKQLSPLFEGESVRVYVGGRSKGVTPMTLHVSRVRGEYEVSLRKGKEEVRRFEIGLESSSNASPERNAVYMDLDNNTSVMGIKTFEMDDLESSNDTLFYIPYYPSTLSIDDAKFGLTLIISD